MVNVLNSIISRIKRYFENVNIGIFDRRSSYDRAYLNRAGFCKWHPEMEMPWPCDICKDKAE